MRKRMLLSHEAEDEVEEEYQLSRVEAAKEEAPEVEYAMLEVWVEECVVVQHPSTYEVAEDFQWGEVDSVFGTQVFWNCEDAEYYDLFNQKQRDWERRQKEELEGKRRRGDGLAPAFIQGRLIELPTGMFTEADVESRKQKRPKFSLEKRLPSEEELMRRRQEQIDKGMRLSESKEARRARRSAEAKKKLAHAKMALGKTVSKSLSVYYKEGRFASKEAFKHLARQITHKLRKKFEASMDGKLHWNDKIKGKTQRFVDAKMKQMCDAKPPGWKYERPAKE